MTLRNSFGGRATAGDQLSSESCWRAVLWTCSWCGRVEWLMRVKRVPFALLVVERSVFSRLTDLYLYSVLTSSVTPSMTSRLARVHCELQGQSVSQGAWSPLCWDTGWVQREDEVNFRLSLSFSAVKDMVSLLQLEMEDKAGFRVQVYRYRFSLMGTLPLVPPSQNVASCVLGLRLTR